MIKEIEFKNYRVLKAAKVPLGRCTLIVGPNGCGKSTVLGGLETIARGIGGAPTPMKLGLSAGASPPEKLHIRTVWDIAGNWIAVRGSWQPGSSFGYQFEPQPGQGMPGPASLKVQQRLRALRSYSLDAGEIAMPVQLEPGIELSTRGRNLPVVLTQLQDLHPERFEALNAELGRWLPEFDRVLFTTPGPGLRGFALRTRVGRHVIPAEDLSQGVLLALCMLTMAYLPEPPTVLCLEEPDRGIHPRLLREVRDALYRLAYPESVGEKREPVQVIATTHSPYMLDLFREHPEEIVLADKDEQGVSFRRLSDIPHFEEILKDVQLSEAWYSGVLGGVPKTP